MTQEETKAEELREVDDPEFMVLGTKLPNSIADAMEKHIARKRRQEQQAKDIMNLARRLSLKFMNEIMEEIKEVDKGTSPDEQAELLADNHSMPIAVASMLVARCVIATWRLAGPEMVQKASDLTETAVSGFISDLMGPDGYDGPIMQPEAREEETT